MRPNEERRLLQATSIVAILGRSTRDGYHVATGSASLLHVVEARYTLVAAWAADGTSRGSSSEMVPAASRRPALAQRHASRPCHW